MNKILFVIALSTILSGCVNDPTASEALCQAQANDPSATCSTDTETETDTSFFTDEELKKIEEAVEEISSTDTETETVVE